VPRAERMRISYLIDDLRVGGAQTHLARLVHGLAARGLDLEVLSFGPESKTVTAQIPASVPIVRFGLASVRSLGFPAAFVSLVRHLRRRRPDVVHTYLNTAGVFGLLAARLAGVKHVAVSRRDMGVFRSSRIRMLEAWLSRRLADRVFCVCEAVAAATRQHEGIAEDRLRVVLNGSDVRGVRARAEYRRTGTLRFCMVAAMNREQKGHRELLEAAARLRDLPVSFQLAGDGPLRLALEERALELELQGVVRFVGETSDIQTLLDDADVVVVPSYTEGISNAALEGMAKGLPVIASAVDGNLETVADGETGRLVPPRDPQALADAMRAYAQDRVLVERHGRAARRRAKELFDLEGMIDAYQREYAALTESGPRPVSGKRRIALVENSSGVGGTAKVAYQLAQSLDPSRFAVVVFARERVGWHAQLAERGTAEVVFNGIKPYKAAMSGRPWRDYPAKLLELLRLLPHVISYVRAFRSRRIELVHTGNNVFDQIPALVAARILRLPTICHIHDQLPLTRVETVAARLPHRFFVLSTAARDLYAATIPRQKIDVVRNGLLLSDYDDVPHAAATMKRPAIGVVGRLVDWKGQETLIRAVRLVRERVPEAHFYVIGDDPSGSGDYEDLLRDLVRELGCEEAVVFTGWVDDPRSLMAQLDISVCTSISPEPFGLVLLESMALGVPVIATRHGGPVDIISEGEDGFLYPPGDAPELARLIVSILDDWTLATRLAAAGREKVRQQYALPAIVPLVEAAYDALLATAKAKS
jgi:glycosyltransferase involved in cell wall biosynthesis